MAGNSARPLVTAKTTEGKDASFKSELAGTQTTDGGFADIFYSDLKLSLGC